MRLLELGVCRFVRRYVYWIGSAMMFLVAAAVLAR